MEKRLKSNIEVLRVASFTLQELVKSEWCEEFWYRYYDSDEPEENAMREKVQRTLTALECAIIQNEKIVQLLYDPTYVAP